MLLFFMLIRMLPLVWGYCYDDSLITCLALALACRTDLKQYFNSVIMTILKRMQTSKTDKFVHLVTRFFLFTMALNVEGLGPDYVIGTIEEIQPR